MPSDRQARGSRGPPLLSPQSPPAAAPVSQAYLRLGGIRFAVQECITPSASPTGQVPALDTSADLVGTDASAASAPPLAEFGAARTMVEYLKAKVGAAAQCCSGRQGRRRGAGRLIIKEQRCPRGGPHSHR